MNKNDVKKAAKKAGQLWVAKKGLQYTGGLIKIGLIAGVVYYAYQFFKNNREEIKRKISEI